MVPLTIAERKHRLPHGAGKAVASRFGVSGTYVTDTMNGVLKPTSDEAKKKLRRVQVWIARKYFRLPVAVVFPESEQETAPVMARAS